MTGETGLEQWYPGDRGKSLMAKDAPHPTRQKRMGSAPWQPNFEMMSIPDLD